jgi:hypothetical protein
MSSSIPVIDANHPLEPAAQATLHDLRFLLNVGLMLSPLLYVPSLRKPAIPPSIPLFLLLTHSLRVMNHHISDTPLQWSFYYQSLMSIPLQALLYYRTKPLVTSFFYHLLIGIATITLPIDALFLTASNPMLSISCVLESAVPLLQLLNPSYGSVSMMVAGSWLVGDTAKLGMYLTQPTDVVFIFGVVACICADAAVCWRIFGGKTVKAEQLKLQKMNYSPLHLGKRQDAHIL